MQPDDGLRYDIEHVHVRTGRVTRLHLRPMTHAQACVHLSKIQPYPWRRTRLVYADAGRAGASQ